MNIVRRIARQSLSVPPLIIPGKEAIRLRCYCLLAAGDTLAIGLAFLTANIVMNWWAPAPIEHSYVMFGVTLPLFAIQASANGTYGAITLDDAVTGANRAARALIAAGAIVLLIGYLLKASAGFSRGIFALGFVLAFVFILIGRKLLHPIVMRMLSGSAHSIIVVRDDVLYERQEKEILLDVADMGFDPFTADPRDYHLFAQSVATADRLVVACHVDRAAAWAPVLRSLPIDSEILTDVNDQVGAVGINRIGSKQTFVVNYGPMNFSSRVLKRGFDVVVSLGALVALSPIFIGTALAIRLESRGPVFFRQERIGRGNTIFRIFKFRSMFAHAADEHGHRLTQHNDARVTRVGAFIRRTSIDEIPQLLNVLRGEMSIVGPRPHALAAKAADQLYWDVDSRYRERHVIKPGMTGLAQVRGFRGNTHQIEDLTNRLQADLEYVANWSVRTDLSILLRTLQVVFHTNAY